MSGRCIIPRVLLLALAAPGVLLLNGCGGFSQQPLAPTVGVAGPRATGQAGPGPGYFTISFSPGGLAAKPAAGVRIYSGTDSGWFYRHRDGRLSVDFREYAREDQVQVKKATFEVAKGSIDSKVEITMTVYSGSSLADIQVQFNPSGLGFDPSATLTLELKGDLDAEDLDGLKAYHIEGSKVTEISVQVSPEGRKRLELILKVPGFSRYTLGDGDNLWGAGDDPMPAPSVPGSP